MGQLTPEQRNDVFWQEAERTGIHQSILAALYQTQGFPALVDGEVGLGVKAVEVRPLRPLNTFSQQVRYAANLIRSLSETLIEQGWTGEKFWNAKKGCYTEDFVKAIAQGYTPHSNGIDTACLTPCDATYLFSTYLTDIERDAQLYPLASNLEYLDRALLFFVNQIPDAYLGLSYQREALLELMRLWQKVDNAEIIVRTFAVAANVDPENLAEAELDSGLIEFVQRISSTFQGYPYQWEALLRMTQLWRRLESRFAAIASLNQDISPDCGLDILDSVLIAFVREIPATYQAKGTQRNALTELFRVWHQLESRPSAIAKLGVDPNEFALHVNNPPIFRKLAAQIDQALLNFVQQIPKAYQEVYAQREALIRCFQLWWDLPTRQTAMDKLIQGLKQLERSPYLQQRFPGIKVFPSASYLWTPYNIELSASIVPKGNLTWAEATEDGNVIPIDQLTVNAIVRIATLAEFAQECIGSPLRVSHWYSPPKIHSSMGRGPSNRHSLGDAIAFTCENFSGNELYWMLDPWWPGGLGRYSRFPNLCYIDARGDRIRYSELNRE